METQNKITRRSKPVHGRAYTLKEFADRYGLRQKDAAESFDRFGPSSVEPDLLMKAKQRSSEVFFI